MPSPDIENKETSKDVSIESLIKKNLQQSEMIYLQNQKIQRRLTWIVAGSYIRLVVLLIPLILGIIFLPSLIEKMVEEYQNILMPLNANNQQKNSDVFSNISPNQIQEFLKQLQ